MGSPDANTQPSGPARRPSSDSRRRQPACEDPIRWYVARALGEETAISAHPTRKPRRARAGTTLLSATVALSLGISACGGDKQRQDANEPAGEFEVEVVSANFPTKQRLAQTSDLRMKIENTGEDEIGDLAVTIYTGDEKASGSFSIRSSQPDLADPNRPVWILEEGYPKLVVNGIDDKDLDQAPPGGAEAAQTGTFSFGTVAAGDSKDIVWRLTPVVAGTYTVHYELAAGLTGKAKAVTDDGSPVEGEFVVTISDKPPSARVNDAGEVVIEDAD